MDQSISPRHRILCGYWQKHLGKISGEVKREGHILFSQLVANLKGWQWEHSLNAQVTYTKCFGQGEWMAKGTLAIRDRRTNSGDSACFWACACLLPSHFRSLAELIHSNHHYRWTKSPSLLQWYLKKEQHAGLWTLLGNAVTGIVR